MYNYVIQAKLWNGIEFPKEPSHFYLDCWEWQGRKGKGGHGIFQHRGRTYLAHRTAYELATGTKLPKKIVVRHLRCNNPGCCNPKHLRSGTSLDNVADRVAAKRSAFGPRNGTHTQPHQVRRGSQHGRARLTEKGAIFIKAFYRDYRCYGLGRYMAQQFGLALAHIMRVAKGQAWSHVTVPEDYEIPIEDRERFLEWLARSAAAKGRHVSEAKRA